MAPRKKLVLPPSRPEVIAFLRDIKDNPDDDTPRLILADWLEDHNDPRGEFLRLQVEAARLEREGHSASKLFFSQAKSLEQLHRSQWLLELPLQGATRFHRGLIDIETHPHWLFNPSRRRLTGSEQWEWVETLRMWEGVDTTVLDRWLDSPLVHSVGDLLVRIEPGASLDSFARLMHSDAVRRVRSLVLLWVIDSNWSQELGRILATAEPLAGLRLLWVNVQPFGLEAVRALASSAFLRKLHTLGFHNSSIGNEGLRILSQSPQLAHIAHLTITDDAISEEGVDALIASRLMGTLKTLKLSMNRLSPRAVRRLWDEAHLRGLHNIEC